MKYILTKEKDNKFEGVHPNGINEGYVFEGTSVSDIVIGNCFYIFGNEGRFLRTSTIKSISFDDSDNPSFETENSTYKLERFGSETIEL